MPNQPPTLPYDPASRIRRKVLKLHGVLSVDQADNVLWIHVATLASLVEGDVFGNRGVAAKSNKICGCRVFKVKRQDTATVSALEAALAVELQKGEK